MANKIDMIVYWVDGNDPEWQKKKAVYAAESGQDSSSGRYRDWDNLQYLFRGIEKFAPWIHRVFFVSDGQIPKWMNTNCPKLRIVDHKDYIPSEYLPVFNANPIELNFHRIEDLSEQFLVANDDCFFTSMTKETDFFINGMPVEIFMEYPIMCGGNNMIFSHMLANDFNAIGKAYERKEYKKRLRNKILSPKYGRYFFYNLAMYIAPFPRFYGMLTPHFTRPYLKSSFTEAWENEYELLDQTCSHRFRDERDVNIYLIRMRNLMQGNFEPRNIFKYGNAFFIHEENDDVCKAIEKQSYKTICVNDDCGEAVFENMKRKVNRSFEKILPEKCMFEK